MPIVKEREYRTLAAPLSAADAAKRINTDYYVEGYATTFGSPYLLFEFEDGWKYYEVIEAHAVDGADLSDVIFQYNQPDNTGLFMCADLGRTDGAKQLYQDIAAGMVTKMSWAFTVKRDSISEDREKRIITRCIQEIKKVFDVSAVDRPANEDTEINARNFATRSYGQMKAERLQRQAQLLKIKTML